MGLIAPEYVAVLNPFTKEGREVVKSSPPLDRLPQRVVDRALARVKWRSGREMVVDFKQEAVQEEVLSFYLACQGVAAVSYPYSRESRLLSEATKETIKYRLYDLFKRGYEDFCLSAVKRSFRFVVLERGDGARVGDLHVPKEDLFKLRDQGLAEDGVEVVDDRVLDQYFPKYAIKWSDLAPLLKHRRVELTKLYLVRGWAVITPKELWELFANYVSVKTEEYITSLYERFSDKRAPPELSAIGERIAALLPPEPKELRERFARVPTKRLRPELFPPCVRKSLAGVGAGARNYAITVLLTSFLSYARVSPSGKAVFRIADFIDDISVVTDEIVPLIFEAAERCSPPLFKDQPQERANIFYHLGFGMTVEPRMADSGRSKWYRTPNCRKIQIAAPALCDPDELCRKIKNPLTYYYRRLSEGR